MPSNNPISISRLGQIEVSVTDMPRAIDFYQYKLGLPPLFMTRSFATFDCNGPKLKLSLKERKKFTPRSSVLYFMVDDIQSAYEQLLSQDVTFQEEPHIAVKLYGIETWMAFLTDPDGNPLALMSEVPVTPSEEA